jgi:hypothetical protein
MSHTLCPWRVAACIIALLFAGASPAVCRAQTDRSPSDVAPAEPEIRGVWRVVDPARQSIEAHSTHDLTGLLRINQDFGARPWRNSTAKGIRFEHNVWALEFSYKPVRFVTVDVPRPNGRLQQKLVWYLPYRVKNTGDAPVQFVPRFVLESHDAGKVYPEQIIPPAMDAIRRREGPNRSPLNSAEIAGEIPPASSDEEQSVRYGVATWTDIDPRTDRFSIYIQGLTNAYRWEDPPLEGTAGPRVFPRVLQLNFWRPGDEHFPHEREIRVGIPEDRYHFTKYDFVAGEAELTPAAEARLDAIAPSWRHVLDSTPVFALTLEPSFDPVVGNVPVTELVGALDQQRQAAAELDQQRKQQLIAELDERGIAKADMRVAIQSPQAAAPIPQANQPAGAPARQAAPGQAAPRSLPGEFWVYVTPEFLYNGVK